MSRENNIKWEERKALLLRSLFHDDTSLSTSNKDDNDEIITPFERPGTPLPELIIEREPNIRRILNDETEEFYLILKEKVRLFYKMLFHKIPGARTSSCTFDSEKSISKDVGNKSSTSINFHDVNVDVDIANQKNIIDDIDIRDDFDEINANRYTDNSLQSQEGSCKENYIEKERLSDKTNSQCRIVSHDDNENDEESSSNDSYDDGLEVTTENSEKTKSIDIESEINSAVEHGDYQSECSNKSKSESRYNYSPTFTQATDNKVLKKSIHSFHEYCSDHSSPEVEDESAEIEDGSAEIEDGSVEVEDESAEIEDESAEMEDGSAEIEDGSAEIEEESAEIEDERMIEEEDTARDVSKDKSDGDDQDGNEQSHTTSDDSNPEVNKSIPAITEKTSSPPRRSLEIMRRANVNTDQRISLPVARKRKSSNSNRNSIPRFVTGFDAMEESSSEQILTGSFIDRDVEDSNPELSIVLRTSTPEPRSSNEDHSPRKISKATSPKEVYWDDIKNYLFAGSVQTFNVCRCRGHVCDGTF